MQRVWVVKHGYAFSPCFIGTLVNKILEGFWKMGVGIVIVVGSNANHYHTGRLETRLPSHSVKLRYRAGCREDDSAYMFGVTLKEVSRRNFLFSNFVLSNLQRRDD